MPVRATELSVAGSGGMYTAIQPALDAAHAGDTVTVHAGTYDERLVFSHGGTATGGYITLRAMPGEAVYLNGRNEHSPSAPHMIDLNGASFVRVTGLHICSNLATSGNGGSGIHFEGAGSHIELVSNTIYWMRGVHGMGITIYGTEAGQPVSDVVIAGNLIRDCQPATSEAVTLNGNVAGFIVEGNEVRDVNNIGIDFIGGEAGMPGGARNGVCRGNTVRRARSSYGGGYAAGIYSDGGRNIVIERNSISECDLGIELGAENAGWVSSNVTVRSNLVFLNDKAGISFGGYAANKGRVVHSAIINNTVFKNNNRALGAGEFHGELIIQYAASNAVCNNLVYISERGDRRALLDDSAAGNAANAFAYNLYFCDAAAPAFQWHATAYSGFTAYTNATGADRLSLYADPLLLAVAQTDLHLTGASPAVNAGDPACEPDALACDFEGNPRVIEGRVDMGAYEYVPEPALAWVLPWVYALGRMRGRRERGRGGGNPRPCSV